MPNYIEPHVTSVEQVTVIGNNSVQSTTNRVLCIFMADCGPLEPTEINSQSEFLRTYTDGSPISRDAHLSFFHALKHSQAFPLMCLRVSSTKVTTGITNRGGKILTKGDKIMSYVGDALRFNFENAQNLGPEGWVIKIGNFVFAPDTAVGGSEYTELYTPQDTLVVIDPEYGEWPPAANCEFSDFVYFINRICSYLNKFTNFVAESGPPEEPTVYLHLKRDSPFTEASSIESQTLDVDTPSAGLYEVNFIISPKAPSKTDIFEASISDIVEFTIEGQGYTRFNLTITARGESNTYALSTYPQDLDSTGANIYLTSFNDFQDDLTIIPYNEYAIIGSTGSIPFGANDYDFDEPKDIIPMELLNEAIATIEELEGVRISLISDCGMCQPAYQYKLSMLGETLKALPALSCPDSKLIPYVTNYVKSVGIDSSYAWFGWPWNTDRALCDFPVDLSPVCYYIERISANAAGNQEFAPVFGKTTGVSTGRNIKSNPTLKQRNELQSYNINPLYYSKADNICYFKNDLTQLSQPNVLQEEHTRRIINKIRYEIDLLCESYLSYDWDEASCYKIKGAIESYFDNVIYKMLRTIEPNPEINVTLNGLNKVKVEVAIRPKGSIKYINVYYNVLSMAA